MIDFLKILNSIEEKYKKRGVEYYGNGFVEIISKETDKIEVKVLGARLYKVMLFKNNLNEDDAICSCPAFNEGFGRCKHIASVCFALQDENYKPSEKYSEERDIFIKVENFLKTRTKDQLISMIMYDFYDIEVLENFCHRNNIEIHD